jgi:hypothetical protein
MAEGFWNKVGKGLEAAGKKTEQLGRLGLAKAELEKEKVVLSRAMVRLGEVIYAARASLNGKPFDEHDPRFAGHFKDIAEIHERIAAIEKRMQALRG